MKHLLITLTLLFAGTAAGNVGNKPVHGKFQKTSDWKHITHSNTPQCGGEIEKQELDFLTELSTFTFTMREMATEWSEKFYWSSSVGAYVNVNEVSKTHELWVGGFTPAYLPNLIEFDLGHYQDGKLLCIDRWVALTGRL